MQRLLEYIVHHPYLAGGALAVAVALIVNEIRERSLGLAAIGSSQAVQMMNQGALLLDVRDKEAYDAGHIGEARHVKEADLESSADSWKKWREKNVIVYCDSGVRSAAAARTLTRLGFARVFSLAGGLDAWRKENLPLVKSAPPKGQGKRNAHESTP